MRLTRARSTLFIRRYRELVLVWHDVAWYGKLQETYCLKSEWRSLHRWASPAVPTAHCCTAAGPSSVRCTPLAPPPPALLATTPVSARVRLVGAHKPQSQPHQTPVGPRVRLRVPPASNPFFEAAFAELDEDGSGALSFGELANMIRR